ncbi:hypothetical protein [Streptomyces sp. DH24]|uniref:hypothetical protein n=1 Tax=Streptomyces sp. DH24 TaxID=3040123 RepID=UPI0024412A67|nr:hypothetical protein [Streptomyces sp. DH24]MDG9716965.1 hypothetical protein [Streptomyces sp. DH24]
MSHRWRIASQSAAVLAVCLAVTSCNGSSDEEIPQSMCGTRVDRDLARPLITSTDDLDEYSRVDRQEAISAPCALLSGGDPVLEFHFSWTPDAPGFAERDQFDPVFNDVAEWKVADLGEESVVGNNGAIVSTPCKTTRGEHFTLKLHMPRVKITDRSHRQDIIAFMRDYFPATVKTLHCE